MLACVHEAEVGAGQAGADGEEGGEVVDAEGGGDG